MERGRTDQPCLATVIRAGMTEPTIVKVRVSRARPQVATTVAAPGSASFGTCQRQAARRLRATRTPSPACLRPSA